jgi:hypothetical protein
MTVRVALALRGRSLFLLSMLGLLLSTPDRELHGMLADAGSAAQQDSAASGQSEGVYPGRLAVVGGVYLAGVTAIHLYQQDAWWRGRRGPFHVEEDLVYAKNIDKVGHFYGAQVFTFTLGKSLEWANVPESDALIFGAVGATLFQTYIEIEDGFALDWGFDRVDFLADLLGAWYPVAQHEIPVLRNFDVKMSYSPKSPAGAGAFPGQRKTAFDDYEGQTFWFCARMGQMIDPWPRWLNISVGVAVRNNLTPQRYLAVFLAPDLDLKSIVPRTTPFLRTLGEALDFIHMPLPAVQISPGVIWYGVYF